MGETRDKHLRRLAFQLDERGCNPQPFNGGFRGARPLAYSVRPPRFLCGPTAFTRAIRGQYKYTADFGELRFGVGQRGGWGQERGLVERFGQCRILQRWADERELFEHIGTTILNVTRGSHYGGGTDSSWAAGEV